MPKPKHYASPGPIIKQPARAILLTWQCPGCGKGEMKSVGMAIHGCAHVHICNSCGFRATAPKQYPCVDFEPTDATG